MSFWVVLGALHALLSVAAGAFGAHGLKARVGPDLLVVFETGARYHMYHSLALVGLGLFAGLRPEANLAPAGWAMVVGIALFSGSLYALALTGVRALGAITPFGGVAFLVGWALFAWAAYKAG